MAQEAPVLARRWSARSQRASHTRRSTCDRTAGFCWMQQRAAAADMFGTVAAASLQHAIGFDLHGPTTQASKLTLPIRRH